MSVPRNAFFYWTDGPLPWLREQALLSFQRHHPDWTVYLGSPEDRPTPPGVLLVRDDVSSRALPPAARSDAWRWWILSRLGGVYADTDVVFFRPIDDLLVGEHDAWLTQDLGARVEQSGLVSGPNWVETTRVCLSIGVVASRKGSQFFSRLARLAQDERPKNDYQSHGTTLVAAHWRELAAGVSLGKLPAAVFYDLGSSPLQVRALWDGTRTELSEVSRGLHWYGGSPESRRFEGARSTRDLPPRCLVRAALARSSR